MEVFFNIIKEKNPLSAESIGHEWSQPPVERKTGYPYYHWLQTYSGSGKIKIENKEILLKKGQGILIPSFIPHSYFQNSAEIWITNFATFGGSLVTIIPELLQTAHYILAEDSNDFSYTQWLLNLLNSIKKQNKKSTEIETSVAIFHFLLHIRSQTAQEIITNNQLYEIYVRPAIDWIEKNYSFNCSVTEIARQVYISPQYLTRLFQKYVDRTPYKYLQAYRMKKAKEILITQKNKKIKDLAIEIGFNDVSHFVAAFKQETGATPEQFRKMY